MVANIEELCYCIYIIITSIFGLIALILVIHLTYKALSTNNSKISLFFRNGTIISSIGCTVCIFCDLIHFILSMTTGIDLLSSQNAAIIVIANLAYYIGCILFYILLVMRVYIAFKNTQYELSQCLYYSLWFLIIISILASISHIFIMIFVNEKQKTITVRTPFIILMINDALLNIILFVLFIYKLRKVSITSESFNDDKDIITFQTTKTLHVITRHSVLFSIAILSNQLFYTSGYVISFYPPTNNILIGIVYQSRVLENMINVIVLYLSMTINTELYTRFCLFCHRNLMKCCTKSVQKATDYYRL